MLLTAMSQMTMDTIIPTLFGMDFQFQNSFCNMQNTGKSGQGMKIVLYPCL